MNRLILILSPRQLHVASVTSSLARKTDVVARLAHGIRHRSPIPFHYRLTDLIRERFCTLAIRVFMFPLFCSGDKFLPTSMSNALCNSFVTIVTPFSTFTFACIVIPRTISLTLSAILFIGIIWFPVCTVSAILILLSVTCIFFLLIRAIILAPFLILTLSLILCVMLIVFRPLVATFRSLIVPFSASFASPMINFCHIWLIGRFFTK